MIIGIMPNNMFNTLLQEASKRANVLIMLKQFLNLIDSSY